MEGCEEGLERLLREAVRLRYAMQASQFCYLEIGVASGQTLLAMSTILKDAANGDLSWGAVGIDIPEGWSLDRAAIIERFKPETVAIWENDPERGYGMPDGDGVTIYLHPAAHLLNTRWSVPIDFALIDGCHNKECCKADFLAVEKHCRPGSIVAFHDAAEGEQCGPEDGHSNVIHVYPAMCELGLLNSNNGAWELVEWLRGDKVRRGNSCAVFRMR